MRTITQIIESKYILDDEIELVNEELAKVESRNERLATELKKKNDEIIRLTGEVKALSS